MNDSASLLRNKLQGGRILRAVGAHNGLGARIIERHGFDAVWASGLEISTAHGLPDANILTMTENLEAARTIHDATALPVLCDCDTGYGNASNVKHMVRRYEAAGMAAIVIEDKIFPKVNSFIAGRQSLAPVEEFAGRLRAAKETQRNPSFMVFARIEALIAGFGLEEALRRAQAYVAAGADGIVIHSKAATPEEIFAFARRFRDHRVPLVAIPTTYPQVTAQELEREGFAMVIYANHGLRASIRAMERTLSMIAQKGCSAPIESEIASLKEVFDLQGMQDFKEDERRFTGAEKVRAIIPAARDHRYQPDLKDLLREKPLCMLEVGGKSVLERQMDALQSAGISDVTVIGGHLHDRIHAEGAQLLFNPDYGRYHCAQSILFARQYLEGKTLVVYSDILFDRQIPEHLLRSPHAITLVIDRSYQTLPSRQKALDLVCVEETTWDPTCRRLEMNTLRPIRAIGKRLGGLKPTHEFIGMAFLRERGTRELQHAWDEAVETFRNSPFYEAASPLEADFTDLLRYLLDRGFPLFGMEIDHGWSEIHSKDDYQRVCAHFQKPAAVFA